MIYGGSGDDLEMIKHDVGRAGQEGNSITA